MYQNPQSLQGGQNQRLGLDYPELAGLFAVKTLMPTGTSQKNLCRVPLKAKYLL
jgi:hypothetical protein